MAKNCAKLSMCDNLVALLRGRPPNLGIDGLPRPATQPCLCATTSSRCFAAGHPTSASTACRDLTLVLPNRTQSLPRLVQALTTFHEWFCVGCPAA
jgi:hypothetical protein